MSNRQEYCSPNFVLFSLAFPRLHKTFITDRGRPYTDTPFVNIPGILKSSQPIRDDPNLRMAFDLAYNCVRYSYGDFHKWMYPQKNSWFMMDPIPFKRMMTGGTSILGNPHIKYINDIPAGMTS